MKPYRKLFRLSYTEKKFLVRLNNKFSLLVKIRKIQMFDYVTTTLYTQQLLNIVLLGKNLLTDGVRVIGVQYQGTDKDETGKCEVN